MPRYYLHLYNCLGDVRDDEGEELSALEDARDCAFQAIRDILSEEVRQGRIDLRGRIEIADAGKRVVEIVPFSDAVEILAGRPES